MIIMRISINILLLICSVYGQQEDGILVDEDERVQQEVLSLLGLDERPKHRQQRFASKLSASRYMLGLYQEEKSSLFHQDNSIQHTFHNDDDNGEFPDVELQKARGTDLTSQIDTRQEKALLQMSDLIMSFLPTYINSSKYHSMYQIYFS